MNEMWTISILNTYAGMWAPGLRTGSWTNDLLGRIIHRYELLLHLLYQDAFPVILQAYRCLGAPRLARQLHVCV